MSLVTSYWLENNLSSVKIIDCSWHMPGIDRNPQEEYSKNHIPGAIFFDLDRNSDQDTDLPNMLPAKGKWEEIVSSMGISNTCLLYTSPSPRDRYISRMPSSA